MVLIKNDGHIGFILDKKKLGWLSSFLFCLWGTKVMYCYVVKWPFSYNNSSNATILKKLCKSKKLVKSVVIRKNPLQITSDHFRMTTLWFDEFLNAHSYLILNTYNEFLVVESWIVLSKVIWSSQLQNRNKLSIVHT